MTQEDAKTAMLVISLMLMMACLFIAVVGGLTVANDRLQHQLWKLFRAVAGFGIPYTAITIILIQCS